MNYNTELIREKNYKPTFWSGGMATELTTYPLNSDFASKNFLWRLGIAKIDIPESNFSELKNVSRKFMVTEGQITLDHEKKYKKLLNTFEQDTFMGDWKTKTYGKASVFNLMTKENYDGELMHISITHKKKHTLKYELPLNKELAAICFYSLSGSFKTIIDYKTFSVNNHDLLIVNPMNLNSNHEFILFNNSLEITNIIVSIVYKH